MKSKIYQYFGIIYFLLLSSTLSGQGKRIYNHPFLNIRFEASPGWQQLPRPEDRLIYEIADPEKTVHVMLWYTATMQDARGYLRKMADMKGLRWEEETSIQGMGDDAWQVDATGHIWGMEARTLLAVVQNGFDNKHADHNALYIVMIWCPEQDFTQHEQQMTDILNSVRFTE